LNLSQNTTNPPPRLNRMSNRAVMVPPWPKDRKRSPYAYGWHAIDKDGHRRVIMLQPTGVVGETSWVLVVAGVCVACSRDPAVLMQKAE
jgi:hypothetical protein